jgi:hypothetical protein
LTAVVNPRDIRTGLDQAEDTGAAAEPDHPQISHVQISHVPNIL